MVLDFNTYWLAVCARRHIYAEDIEALVYQDGYCYVGTVAPDVGSVGSWERERLGLGLVACEGCFDCQKDTSWGPFFAVHE